MVNPKDKAGNAEDKEEEYFTHNGWKTFHLTDTLQAHIHAYLTISKYQSTKKYSLLLYVGII